MAEKLLAMWLDLLALAIAGDRKAFAFAEKQFTNEYKRVGRFDAPEQGRYHILLAQDHKRWATESY